MIFHDYFSLQEDILSKQNYTKNVGKPKKRDQNGVFISMSYFTGGSNNKLITRLWNTNIASTRYKTILVVQGVPGTTPSSAIQCHQVSGEVLCPNRARVPHNSPEWLKIDILKRGRWSDSDGFFEAKFMIHFYPFSMIWPTLHVIIHGYQMLSTDIFSNWSG